MCQARVGGTRITLHMVLVFANCEQMEQVRIYGV
jgi:hypothetical protein